jgi:hypothetical protein
MISQLLHIKPELGLRISSLVAVILSLLTTLSVIVPTYELPLSLFSLIGSCVGNNQMLACITFLTPFSVVIDIIWLANISSYSTVSTLLVTTLLLFLKFPWTFFAYLVLQERGETIDSLLKVSSESKPGGNISGYSPVGEGRSYDSATSQQVDL